MQSPGRHCREAAQCNYTRFMKQEQDDGGHSKFDVPKIAYEWRDICGAHVKVNQKCVSEVGESVRVQRRVFYPAHLEFAEECMCLMIVGRNRHGRKQCNPCQSADAEGAHLLKNSPFK